jgi:hypothetical protein
MTTGFDWVAATGGIVAGVGGIASVVLALKSIKLTETAQKKVDEILEGDRRYHAFVDGKVQAGLKILNDDRGPRFSSKRGLRSTSPRTSVTLREPSARASSRSGTGVTCIGSRSKPAEQPGPSPIPPHDPRISPGRPRSIPPVAA